MMNKRITLPMLCFLFLGSTLFASNPDRVDRIPASSSKTLILYDSDSGTIPAAQLMSFADFPAGAAAPTYELGATILDTTTSGSDTFAGWISGAASTPGFPILDATAGFQVDFSLQVERENHTNNNRAGFSIIILGEDAKGIELAFWENEIWAQHDGKTGGLFRHGEGVVFSNVTDLIKYQVSIVHETYTLTANNSSILTGPVRDYSNFEGFPDPYETPNFLFLGDDTTSAQARVRLSFVSVTGIEPVVPTVTHVSTSTSSSIPTASFTTQPSATPVPSPTPTGNALEFCSSGWIFLAMTISTVVMSRKIKAG